MAQDFDWLGPSHQPPKPRSEHRATLWILRGPSERDLICAAYQVETWVELPAPSQPVLVS